MYHHFLRAAIVEYLSNLTLISDFSENPNEYAGATWVISLKYDNGKAITVYHFGIIINLNFIKYKGNLWYKKALQVICCAVGGGMIGFFVNRLNTVVGAVCFTLGVVMLVASIAMFSINKNGE